MNHYYHLLELPKTATAEEIKKAYRRLSMIYHPDKNNNNPEATAKFQKIAEAYETLGNPEKKQIYDHHQSLMGGREAPVLNRAFVDELFSTFFGMQQSPSSFEEEEENLSLPFRIKRMLQKPTPIIKHIVVPIDKIFTGTTIPLEIERWIMENGTKMFERETIYVTVPKGIDEGEIILLREKGHIAREDCKGDIKLFVKIDNPTEFTRNGLDLFYEKQITVKEALCGFSFELKYITGKVYTILNNTGIICNENTKIIPNLGFSRDEHVGNLIITFRVTFPEQLPADVVEQLKQIDF